MIPTPDYVFEHLRMRMREADKVKGRACSLPGCSLPAETTCADCGAPSCLKHYCATAGFLKTYCENDRGEPSCAERVAAAAPGGGSR